MSIKVVTKIGRILDVFLTEGSALPFAVLSRATGLAPGTLRRLLLAMIEADLVRQDPETRRYELGPKILQLSQSVLEKLDYRRIARPIMERLVEDLQEAAYLAIRTDAHVLYVEICQVRGRATGLTAQVGSMYPVYCTGTGKVLLAYAPHAVRARILAGPMRRFTERTIVDPGDLERELHEIRERGYAVNRQEFTDEVVSVAAPIFDRHGVNIAALAVSGPAYRVLEHRVPEIAAQVKSAAEEISHLLGFRGTLSRAARVETEGEVEQ